MNGQLATIEIKLLSETIFGGDGEIKGTVDIDIQADEFGLPFFHARTLKGVLRKQATWYVACLPEAKRPTFERALLQLFGQADEKDMHHANYEAIRFGNAKLSKSVYDIIRKENSSPRETIQAITTIRTMTSIDDETGTAQDGALRTARMIHSGYTFVAPIFANRMLSIEEKELLTASVKLLRHIGLMRSRGKGEVSCSIQWEQQTKSENISSNKAEQAKYLYLTIDVEEPLKINDVIRSSDSTVALTYIPGRVIRGALIHTYLKEKNIESTQLNTEEIFHQTKTQFWNGYLTINGKRSIPFAQNIFETKSAAKSNTVVKNIYNSLDETSFKQIEHLAPVRVNYDAMLLNQTEIIGANIDINSSLHINLKNNENDPLMYRYESIAPNQQFQAVIQAENNHDFIQWLKQKREFYVWLGGARNSGYGRCKITVQTGSENFELPDNLQRYTDELYIIATSDWIIHNEQGQVVSFLDDAWLSKTIGAKVQLDGQVVNTSFSGGYISEWRAYQPLIRSVKAGSIFRYKIISGTIDESKLESLIARGVGSRTNEGFGRFIALPRWKYTLLQQASDENFERTIEVRRLNNKQVEKEEALQLKRSILRSRTEKAVFDEVNRWYTLTGAKMLELINRSQWAKLLEVATEIMQAKMNLSKSYPLKWETFWSDVKKRTDNKFKLNYEKVKISVDEQKKMSIEAFIKIYLYEKDWGYSEPLSDEAISFSLEALTLFIRKILRQVDEEN